MGPVPRIGLCLLAAMAPAAAVAERAPDRTGTGRGPATTVTAPHTTAAGVTKPPGTAEGPATPAERRRLERIEREDDGIDGSICTGCGR